MEKITFKAQLNLLALISIVFHQSHSFSTVTPNSELFYNPILDGSAYIPFILLHTDGYYYMTLTMNTVDLYVYKSKLLSNWRFAERTHVYSIPSGMHDLRTPKLYFIQGNWYIYFAMYSGDGAVNRRMYVVQAVNPENPMGRYTKEIRLTPFLPEEDHHCIDGFPMFYSDGRLYFIYAGSRPNITAGSSIFLAPMSNATSINGPRIILREPMAAWEGNFNAGPTLLQNGNVTFVGIDASPSAAAAGTYCLGLMGINDGKNPLVAQNWWHNRDGCIFWENEDENVFGYSTGSFTMSPDLTENWMVYSAREIRDNIWSNKTARLVQFTWNPDGTPNFPRSAGLSTPLPLPSGEFPS